MQEADFGAALGPQPMIHGQRTNLSMPLSRPAMRQNGEGKTIGTTGDCYSQKRAGLEASERGEGSGELSQSKWLCRWPGGQQPSRFFSDTARSLIVLPGFG